MSGYLAKTIGKKILGESAKNHFGQEDPYFEQVPATRLDGRPSNKTKKQRKALPPGISEKDGKVLTKVKRRAYRLDMSLFNCCGIRFGWSSVIGIIPGLGDCLDAFMAMMVVNTCKQVEGGLPSSVLSKMYFNVILDFGIGLVPILGDLADALFRANTRNAVELEKYLRAKGQKNIATQGGARPTIDPSMGEEYDAIEDEELGPPPRYIVDANGHEMHPNGPSRPQAAAAPQGKSRVGSFFGNNKKPVDVERGEGGRVATQPAQQRSANGGSQVPQRSSSKLQKGSGTRPTGY